MTNDEMKRLLEEISARLDVIYQCEKHWAARWKKGDKGMILYPPATSAAIDDLERRLGKALPPQYRQFLTVADGCDHFWDDFSFLGTAGKHTARVTAEILEYIEGQKSEVKEAFGAVSEKTITQWEAQNPRYMFLEHHLPIATTFGGNLFVFDVRTKNSSGEMGTVFWDLSWGAWDDRRDESFVALLERTLKEVDERAKKYKPRAAAKTVVKRPPTKRSPAKKAK
jgi:cell wall assembly regulator SMI1